MAFEISDSVEVQATRAAAYLELEDLVDQKVEGPCELLFGKFSNLAENRDWVLELIYLEYVLRRERGQTPILADFQRRFPSFEQDIAILIQVDSAIGVTELDGSSSTHVELGESMALRSASIDKSVSQRLGQVGDYELQEVIGRGGMGIVYRAIQPRLGRAVAVKTMDAMASLDRSLIRRFQAEASLAARLQHPNIVLIYEVGSQADVPFFSMELVTGGTLARATSERPLQPKIAAKLIESLARAVGYAHSHGIVHRDLKPANVLLAPSTHADAIDLSPHDSLGRPLESRPVDRFEPKIADFGLAKSLGSQGHGTLTGALIGTPSYMSPEQVDSTLGDVGPACDIYALGAMMYDVLVGRPPFHAATALETMHQVRHDEPIPLRKLQSKVPQDLETICLTCLRKEPERRYANADALADDLNRYLRGQSIKARSTGPLERSVKWIRRHPSLATLIAAVGLATLSTTWLWRRAELSGLAERVERTRAESLVYARDISLAHLEYRSHHVERCEEILESCAPETRNWEWNYLKGLCEEHVWETPRYKLPILSTALSADGRLLACSYGHWGKDAPEPIRVWDMRKGTLQYELSVPPCNVHCLEFSPDGLSLLSSGFAWETKMDDKNQGAIRIWNLADGSVRQSHENVNAIVARYLPDGKSFLAGFSTGSIVQFSTASGETMREFKGHSSYVLDISISSNGSDFVSSAKDRSLRHWDLNSGKLVNTLLGLTDDAFDLECSPDRKKLQVAGWAGSLSTYDRIGWSLRQSNVQKRSALPRICYTPDGRYLLTAVYGEGAELRDAKSGEVVYQVHGRNGNIKAMAFDRSGRILATGNSDGSTRIWDLNAIGRSATNSFTAGPRVSSIANNPAKHEIALCLKYNHLRGNALQKNIEIRSLDRISEVKQLIGHTDWPTSVAYSSDGTRLISGSLDKTVRIWDLQKANSIHVLTGHDSPVIGVAFLANGRSAVSADRNGNILMWDVESGSQRRTCKTDDDVTSVCLHSNERHFAVGSGSGAIAILDVETGTKVAQIEGDDAVHSLLYSPDGKFLAVTRNGRSSIELRSSEAIAARKESSLLHQLHGHTDQVNSISFSRDSKRLVSSGRDESVRLYDHESGNELLNFHIARGLDNLVHFSSQDGLVFSEEHRLYHVSVKSKSNRSVDELLNPNNLVAWHKRQIENAKAKDDYYANVYHRQRLAELAPPTAAQFYLMGGYKAFIGEIKGGERDLRAALALEDKKSYREMHAEFCFSLGMLDDYRQDCEKLVVATKSPYDLVDVNDTVWVASLSEHSGIDFESWTKTLKELLERANQSDLKKKKVSIAAFENTLGLACYRSKNYSEAIQHLEKSLKLGSSFPAVDYAILAMAHTKLGETEEAQHCLDKSKERNTNVERIEEAGLVLTGAQRKIKALEIPLLLQEATAELKHALESRRERILGFQPEL